MISLPSFHIPNPNGFIERSRNDLVRLGAEIDTEDEIGVATEGFDALGGACVPDADGFVVGGGADVVGVGGPGEVGDAVGVADEAGD